MFDNAGLEVCPAFDTRLAFERVRGRHVHGAHFEVLLEMLDETAPVDDFVRFNQLEQLTFFC